jgi:hypothetical protein
MNWSNFLFQQELGNRSQQSDWLIENLLWKNDSLHYSNCKDELFNKNYSFIIIANPDFYLRANLNQI